MNVPTPLIYVVRHGSTDWNLEKRLQGAKDIPLNETGRQQAANNGRALKALLGQDTQAFDFVSSPLFRTRETMELMRQAMGLERSGYRMDDRLVELSFGDWEGSTLKEIAVSTPEKVKERARNKWDFQPPGKDAESYEILSWRVSAWLNEVKGPTVCVCHGGIVRVMFNLIGSMPHNKAAILPVPQDQILKIEGSNIDFLPAAQ